MDVTARDVVEFWRQAGPAKWFDRSDAFDAQCGAHFLETHFHAARREHDDWMGDAEGALALVLLLDQIPRNVFRGSAHAYATDRAGAPLRRGCGRAGLRYRGSTRRCGCSSTCRSSIPRTSPTRSVRCSCTAVCRAMAWSAGRYCTTTSSTRFGRFPHRNAALGWEDVEERRPEGGIAGNACCRRSDARRGHSSASARAEGDGWRACDRACASCPASQRAGVSCRASAVPFLGHRLASRKPLAQESRSSTRPTRRAA